MFFFPYFLKPAPFLEVQLKVHSTCDQKLIRFLHDELALSTESIEIVEKQLENNPGSFPMLLWQYGLISLEQLDQIFDWLESNEEQASVNGDFLNAYRKNWVKNRLLEDDVLKLNQSTIVQN